MLIHRKPDGFYVAIHNWRGHCPHEDAVIRRAAQWFNRPVPDRPLGKMRNSVVRVNFRPIDNGLYFGVNLNEDEYIPTTELAWQKFLALFGEESKPAAAIAARMPGTSSADTRILEQLAESRQAVRTIEERVKAMKAEYGPTLEQLVCEEEHLDELLEVLKNALAATYDLLNLAHGNPLSPYSAAGEALCYVSGKVLDLCLAIESWIWVRQHPKSGPKWRRRAYEQLVEKARKWHETHLRHWARGEERRARQEEESA